MHTQSCNGVYLNGKRIDPDKWLEVKVKDRLCFGTPISNNSFRYLLEQLNNERYQLVQEDCIAEEESSGGIKKKASVTGVTDTSEDNSESTNDISSPVEVPSGSSVKEARNEMLLFMQEEFLCVICQELFVKAHSLSCSHSYCEKCISDWMKGNKHCPMCRKTIEGKPVPSIAMDNAISKLVECLPEEAQKERMELLKERSTQNKEVILISDSPIRPGSSGVITRSAVRRSIPVNLVSSDSDSNSDSELSSSHSNSDSERYEDFFDIDDPEVYASESYDSDPDYNGLPGYTWGGYGHCYRCGELSY